MHRYRISFLLFLTLLFVSPFYASAASSQLKSSNGTLLWQNPLPHGNTVLSAWFSSSTHGWVVGGLKGVVRTRDGGTTWTLNATGPQLGFMDIAFIPNGKQGCAVGQGSDRSGLTGDSVIWLTADSGANWTQHYRNAKGGGLNAVAFADADNGWAVGNFGSIVHSVNGGKKWTEVEAPAQVQALNFTDVTFADANNGWIMAPGDKVYILRTVNAGAAWTVLTINTTGLSKFSFTDALNGWAAGTDGQIWHTADGGVTWAAQVNPYAGPGKDINDIRFTTALIGWAVVNDGTLLGTADGGVTWSFQNLINNVSLNTVRFSDTQNGWVFGAGGNAFKTSDGGATWNSISTGVRVNFRSISLYKRVSAWVAGDSGVILNSLDKGVTWTQQPTPTTEDLYAVVFRSKDEGWAAGTGGVILRTVDGGDNWLALNSGTDADFKSLSFVSDTQGWAAGTAGTLITTLDGGDTWTIVPLDTTDDLVNVIFPTAKSGWTFTKGGLILHTIDGGATWTKTEAIFGETQTSASIVGASFMDDVEGWILGNYLDVNGASHGAVLHTADSGLTYHAQQIDSPAPLSAVHFADYIDGFVGGEQGYYFLTTNGGKTWRVQYRPVQDQTFLAIAYGHFAYRFGYMVGTDGMILRRK